MPVVPITKSNMQELSEDLMPDPVHYAMAAANIYAEQQLQLSEMPEFEPSEPGDKYRKLKRETEKVE